MKNITITLYDYSELSPDAKEYAHRVWNEGDDLPFLDEAMKDWAVELLERAGMKVEEAKPFYSLGYSQGDGAMIEGIMEWSGKRYQVKQSGHYSHERSTAIECLDDDGDTEAFEAAYIPVCVELAKRGYSYIEEQQSEEAFIDACEANGYTFEESGRMRNA